MIRIKLFTGEIEFDEPNEAAAFWIAHLKAMTPGLEEQIKKSAEDQAAADHRAKFGVAAKA